MSDGASYVPAAPTASSDDLQHIRLFEFTYELRAIGEPTQEYLEALQRIAESITTAKALLRCPAMPYFQQRKEFEQTIEDNHSAVRGVQIFLEPTRVDNHDHNHDRGQVHLQLGAQGTWVLREDRTRPLPVKRLHVADRGLQQVIATLELYADWNRSRGGPSRNDDGDARVRKSLSPPTSPKPRHEHLLQWRRMHRGKVTMDFLPVAVGNGGVGMGMQLLPQVQIHEVPGLAFEEDGVDVRTPVVAHIDTRLSGSHIGVPHDMPHEEPRVDDEEDEEVEMESRYQYPQVHRPRAFELHADGPYVAPHIPVMTSPDSPPRTPLSAREGSLSLHSNPFTDGSSTVSSPVSSSASTRRRRIWRLHSARQSAVDVDVDVDVDEPDLVWHET